MLLLSSADHSRLIVVFLAPTLNMEEEREDSIERVFRDISNANDNLTTLKYKCSPDLQKGNTEKQMCEQQGRLKRCSLKYAGLEAKYLFLEGLKDENWTNRTAEPEKPYRHDLREKCNQVNEEVEDLENDCDRLADTLLKKHGELREKLNVIDLATSKAKKQELEILEGKSREMANKLDGLVSKTTEVSKEMKQKQSEADFAIKQCNAAINSLQHCNTLLQSELSRQQELVDGLKNGAEKQEMTKKQNNSETQEAANWFTRTAKLFRSLSGITVKRFHEYSIVLEIGSDSQSGSSQDAATPHDMVVLLTIHFKPDTSKSELLGAQINLESFPIDDLVSEACRTRDVVGLVQSVKMRVRSYLAGLTEIEELQTTYATDWEPTMGRVRVMLGTSGKIVCTLKVNPLNPYHVTLLRVEDTRAKRELPVTNFQFTESPPSSLSKWIERLHEQLLLWSEDDSTGVHSQANNSM